MCAILPTLISSVPPAFPDNSTAAGNAVFDEKRNAARVLYPVTDPHSKYPSVSYLLEGSRLKAVFPDGEVKWSIPFRGTRLFGGFDFDNDGWIDLGFVTQKPSGKTRGSHKLQITQLFLIKGQTGEIVGITTPKEDKWWPKLGYPTEQWSELCLLFGKQPALFSLTPYYAEQGFFYRYANGKFTKDRYEYPSTPAFDSAYRNAKSNAYFNGYSYIENSHINNGLLLKVNGQDRLLFFTSGRVLQYAVGPFGPDQFLYDHPFLNGGRKDLAARQYGLVALDPAASIVTIVAGASNYSVYRDMKAGKKETDPWGGIERHVTMYDFTRDSLDHRFYSSAHDHSEKGDQYQKRVVSPNRIYISTKTGQASRIAYNVYQDDRWYLHISEPGSTADKFVLSGLFLWDILERDGQTQFVISPASSSDKSKPEAGYLPQWNTGIYHWDETNQKLSLVESIDNAIPHLLPKFHEADKTTTGPWLYPVLTVRDRGELKLLLEGRDGTLFLHGNSHK